MEPKSFPPIHVDAFENERQKEKEKQKEQVTLEEASDKLKKHVDYVPMGLAMVQSIQNVPSSKPLVVLFDWGASHSLVNIKALPKGCNPARSDRVMHSTTIAGKFQTSMQVDLRRIAFPEFHRKRYVGNLRTYVFSSPCRYDMIICVPLYVRMFPYL